MKKIILLSLCWASILPAMELKKEPSTYEHAIALHNLTTAQKAAVHNQSNPLLQLPDEVLDHIVQYLIGNVAHAKTEEELQESVQAIAQLQRSSYRFDNLLKSEEYQKELKVSLKIALPIQQSPIDLVSNANNFGFICNALLKCGYKDKPMYKNTTWLHIAASKGLHRVIKNLLNTDTSNIDLAMDPSGGYPRFTPLALAIIENHVSAVRVLIETGANLDKQGNYQTTPLMLASTCGYTQIVELLIQAKADISLKNEHGTTALDIAKALGHTKIIELLEQSASAEAYVCAKATPHRTSRETADRPQSARNE